MSERITRINGCKIELLQCSDDEIETMLREALERRDNDDREITELEADVQRRIALIDLPMSEVAD